MRPTVSWTRPLWSPLSLTSPSLTRRALAVGLALCLVASPALAAKITIPIVARPAQPAAVAGWSGNLTTLAQNATNVPPNPLPGAQVPAWIGINFSKHHIIAQTNLQVVAALAINAQAGNQGMRDRLVAAIRTISAGAAGGPPAAWNLGPVVWAQVNLFEGPTGFYRSDDPGEGNETTRPRSFDQTRWTRLQTAMQAIGNVRTGGSSSSFETSTDALNQQQTGGKTGFQKIVEAFEALAAFPAHGTVSPFAAPDWVDNGNNAIQLSSLVVYNQSQIQIALAQAKKNAYRVK